MIEAYAIADLERAGAAAPGRVLKGDALRALAKPFVGHESDVFAVTPSPDGRLLVSGSDDQTVRIWNLATQELLLTLFHGSNSEWVGYTPQGFYTGSPKGADLLAWQINRGADQNPDVISAAALRKRFFRPELIDNTLRLASAKDAIRAASLTDVSIDDLVDNPPPRISVLSPPPGTVVNGLATVTISAPAVADPIKRLTVRVGDVQVDERIPTREELAAGQFTFDLPLKRGENTVTVVATNDSGDSAPASLRVLSAEDGPLDARGMLYVVAVGADDYDQARAPGWSDLRFAGADARAFVATMAKTLAPAHTGMDVTLLIGPQAANAADIPTAGPGRAVKVDAPTAANVRNALSRVRNLANANDTVVLFVAGHGTNDGADYLFLPVDATVQGGGWAGNTVVPWGEFERALYASRGRRLLFVDTCHSSGAYNRRLDLEAVQADVTAFVASGPDELALEIPKLGHGVFTYAIRDGLVLRAAEADGNGDRKVHATELGAFLRTRTRALIDAEWPNYETTYSRPRPAPRHYPNRTSDPVMADVK